MTVRGHLTKYGQSFGSAQAWEAIRRSADEWLATCAFTWQEINDMKQFLILGGLLMAAFVNAPVAMMADGDNHQEKRYYDRSGKDYHTWNNNEDRAYRTYLDQQHRDYRDFGKVNRSQQQNYFKWRHQNPDNTLFKVEIR
jgi:type III secretory pathway component EscR